MNLTFEKAIEEHRKMWNWIADNIEGLQTSDAKMEEIYMRRFFPHKSICCNCFCCEYDENFDGGSCKCCPIVWKQNDYCGSEYCGFKEATLCKNYAQAAKIARKIANLPARGKMNWE